MPRYFFNVRHGEESYLDQVGAELAEEIDALNQATTSAGQSIKDLKRQLEPGTDWRLDVVNESGRVIYSIEVKAKTRS